MNNGITQLYNKPGGEAIYPYTVPEAIIIGSDGKTLSNITNKSIIYTADDTTELKGINFSIGDTVKTLGYYNKDDNGGALYKISDSIIFDALDIPLANGLYANYIIQDSKVLFLHFGVKQIPTENCSSLLNTAIRFCQENQVELHFGKGDYYLRSRMLINNLDNADNTKLIIKGLCGNKIHFLGGVKNIAIWIETLNSKKSDIEISGLNIEAELNGEWDGAAQDEVQVFPIKVQGFKNTNIHNNVITNVFCAVGINVRNCQNAIVERNILENVWGSGSDSFGMAIHVGIGTDNVTVRNNKVWNDIENTPETHKMGMAGIVSEFDTGICNIENNIINGYDRGIHVELTRKRCIQKIEGNTITGCPVGIISWNTLSPIIIKNNEISNQGAYLSRVKPNNLGTACGILLWEPVRSQYHIIENNRVTLDNTREDLFVGVPFNMRLSANGNDENENTILFKTQNLHVKNNKFIINGEIQNTSNIYLTSINSNYENNIFDIPGIIYVNGYMLNTKFISNSFTVSEFNIYTPSEIENELVQNSSYRDGHTSQTKSLFKRNKIIKRDSTTGNGFLSKPVFCDFLDNYFEFSGDNCITAYRSYINNTICEVSGNTFVAKGGRHPFSDAGGYGIKTINPNIFINTNGNIVIVNGTAPILINKGIIEMEYNDSNLPSFGYWKKGDKIILNDFSKYVAQTDGYFANREWKASKSYDLNTTILYNNKVFLATKTASSSDIQPAFDTIINIGDTIEDGTQIWKYVGDTINFKLI